MSLIEEKSVQVGMRKRKPVYETYQVGIRKEAVGKEPCEKCHGTGKVIKGSRSLNCERGNHSPTCVGNDDPARCICFCHGDLP